MEFHNTKEQAVNSCEEALAFEKRVKRLIAQGGSWSGLYVDMTHLIICGPISHLACADSEGKTEIRPIEDYDGE
jgi:hypothetical protein